MSENTQQTKEPIFNSILAVCLGFLNIPLAGYTLKTIYGWFLLPITNVPISIVQALGIRHYPYRALPLSG